MAHGEGPTREGENPPERRSARGPLTSRFPGELALRDAQDATAEEAQLCAARFAVLQLAERYAEFGIAPEMMPIELESAAAYIAPTQEIGPADALRLRRVLDGLRKGSARTSVAALLAAGDTSRAGGHVYASAGFHGAAFDLARRIGWNAAALSAASRLAELATDLDRPRAARRWQRTCDERVAACH
jgi:hypothetical protein